MLSSKLFNIINKSYAKCRVQFKDLSGQFDASQILFQNPLMTLKFADKNRQEMIFQTSYSNPNYLRNSFLDNSLKATLTNTNTNSKYEYITDTVPLVNLQILKNCTTLVQNIEIIKEPIEWLPKVEDNIKGTSKQEIINLNKHMQQFASDSRFEITLLHYPENFETKFELLKNIMLFTFENSDYEQLIHLANNCDFEFTKCDVVLPFGQVYETITSNFEYILFLHSLFRKSGLDCQLKLKM